MIDGNHPKKKVNFKVCQILFRIEISFNNTPNAQFLLSNLIEIYGTKYLSYHHASTPFTRTYKNLVTEIGNIELFRFAGKKI